MTLPRVIDVSDGASPHGRDEKWLTGGIQSIDYPKTLHSFVFARVLCIALANFALLLRNLCGILGTVTQLAISNLMTAFF